MRELLDRIEDAKTGKILVSSMYNEIPDYIKRIAHEITETYDPRAGFKYHQNTKWLSVHPIFFAFSFISAANFSADPATCSAIAYAQSL